MQRIAITILSATLIAAATTSYANEAQPELQPVPADRGWFKRPVDATSFSAAQAAPGAVNSPFKFLTEASPL